MIYKLLICLIIICSITSGIGGLYFGYKLGKDSICSDAEFYLDPEIAIKDCKNR